MSANHKLIRAGIAVLWCGLGLTAGWLTSSRGDLTSGSGPEVVNVKSGIPSISSTGPGGARVNGSRPNLLKSVLLSDPRDYPKLLNEAIARKDYVVLVPLFRLWAEADPSAAVKAFTDSRLPESSGPNLRPLSDIRIALLSGWAVNAPADAAAWVSSHFAPPLALPPDLIRSLAETDRTQAFEFAIKYGRASDLHQLIGSALRDWSVADPLMAGAEVVRLLKATHNPSLLEEFIPILAGLQKPELCRQWLATLPLGELSTKELNSLADSVGTKIGLADSLNLRLRAMESSLDSELANRQIKEILSSGLKSRESSTHNDFQEIAREFGRWANQSSDAAVAWANAQTDPDLKNLLLSQLPAAFIKKQDYTSAVSQLEALPVEIRKGALQTLANGFYSQSTAQSGWDFGKQLPPGAERDILLAAFIKAQPRPSDELLSEAVGMVSDSNLKSEFKSMLQTDK